jgi:uncharacterized protein with HEPN domain
VSRDLVLFLEDIEKSCSKIVLYTAGQTRDEVFADEMRFDALLRNLHIIGEAVKNLPPEWRQKHPDVPWRSIAGRLRRARLLRPGSRHPLERHQE